MKRQDTEWRRFVMCRADWRRISRQIQDSTSCPGEAGLWKDLIQTKQESVAGGVEADMLQKSATFRMKSVFDVIK